MEDVTIIVLNWNQYDITYDCLKSVFLSKKINFQVILVDNGSEDDSSKRLSEVFPEVDLVEIKINRGYSQGCNAGLQHALDNYNNDHIVFISNDTVIDPFCIYNLSLSASNYTNTGLVVPKIFYYDTPQVLWYAGGTLNKFLVVGKHLGFKANDCVEFNAEKEVTFGNGCLFLVTRNALQKTGYFDTSFVSYAEDVDFSIRVIMNGYKIIYSPTSVVWHRISYSTTEVKSISKIVYYSIRNTIWLQRKYPDNLSALGLFINVCKMVVKYTGRSILKNDISTLKILAKSIADGYRYNPEFKAKNH